MEEIKCSPKRSMPHDEQGSKRVCLDDQVEMRFLIASKDAGAIIGKSGANINSLRKNFKAQVSITASPGPERVLSINIVRDQVEPIMRELIKFLEEKRDRTDIEMRLLVHTNNAGVIIGKAGAKIKELKKESDTSIKVFPACCPNSTERICLIQGASENVLNGLKLILDLVLPLASRRNLNCRYYDPFDYDQNLVLQYGGYPLDSASQIPFKKAKLPGGIGTFDSLGGGAGPAGWDAKSSHQMMMQSGGMMMNWPYSDASGSKKPNNFYKWPNSGNDYYDMYQMPGQAMGYSGGSNFGMGGMGAGGAGLQPPGGYADGYVQPFDGPGHSKEGDGAIPDIRFNADGSAYFTIPNKLVGAIIGKSGTRIRSIRYESGAEVQIENIKEAGGQHRTVTVKGTEKQIQQACLMLQKSLYDHANELV